ncbi:MAG: C39 family peptidase [Acidobacteriota bacterium]
MSLPFGRSGVFALFTSCWVPAMVAGLSGGPAPQSQVVRPTVPPQRMVAPPFELPAQESLVRVGRYQAIPRPIHVAAARAERPVVRPLRNMYQLDQRFGNLFSADGSSNICGAASTANVLLYLRHTRQPSFPGIMTKSVPAGSTNEDAVRAAFKACGVIPNEGTTSFRIVACAKRFVQEGGYPVDWIWRVGIHATDTREKRAPQPTELRDWIDKDRAVVLLFGWYQVGWDGNSKTWQYTRHHGHFVALAGYDAGELTRFYVSNPLVDYNAPGFGDARESAIRLSLIPLDAAIATPQGIRSLWQTRDLVGGALGVLEEAVVIGTR